MVKFAAATHPTRVRRDAGEAAPAEGSSLKRDIRRGVFFHGKVMQQNKKGTDFLRRGPSGRVPAACRAPSVGSRGGFPDGTFGGAGSGSRPGPPRWQKGPRGEKMRRHAPGPHYFSYFCTDSECPPDRVPGVLPSVRGRAFRTPDFRTTKPFYRS